MSAESKPESVAYTVPPSVEMSGESNVESPAHTIPPALNDDSRPLESDQQSLELETAISSSEGGVRGCEIAGQCAGDRPIYENDAVNDRSTNETSTHPVNVANKDDINEVERVVPTTGDTSIHEGEAADNP